MSSIPFASGSSRKKIVKWTRHKTNLFLVGYSRKYITGCKLFTLRQVFKVLLHEINKPKKNRSTAWFQAEYVVDRALEFWRMVGIKTNPKNNCVVRIQKSTKNGAIWQKARVGFEVSAENERHLFESLTNSGILVPNMLL